MVIVFIKQISLTAFMLTALLSTASCMPENSKESPSGGEFDQKQSASGGQFDQRQSAGGQLDQVESSHLTFMREEEKLARDVYLTLGEMYPNQPVFSNIAGNSEQKHTDTMRDKLVQFNLPDPNPDTNDLPQSIGVFKGIEWGSYFTEKFGTLVELAEQSELAALYVGAFIEELDMKDIAVCPKVMIDKGYPAPCGLEYTQKQALKRSYQNLIRGSENHLRAFVGRIEAIQGYGVYKAQYLSQEEVDTILGR